MEQTSEEQSEVLLAVAMLEGNDTPAGKLAAVEWDGPEVAELESLR